MNSLIAGLTDSHLWYAVPLIVTISLVYAATRHEQMKPILQHAFHTVRWIVGFMAAVFIVLALVSWWVK